jgi:hypothetical protein
VLIWNVAVLVEDLVLFGPDPGPVDAGPETPPARLAGLAFALIALLPLGERWGVFDSWPSFALYAAHTERTAVLLPAEGVAKLPPAARESLVPEGDRDWRRLDLTAWSRRVRGVPVYPQGRACNGVAEALAARYRGVRALRVVQWGRADRLTGRRERDEAVGLDAVRRRGDRYRLNAHPAGRFLRTHP